ncbi:F-box protein CPR1-like [Tripterygium wilfordii]|uniref:F-box protein CPR1-like n=1 Tax=Tripterygium wilfordii TaxID=458696 RepID=UPI0018F80679|nr:F-box protein CPR1-like [Tripterygium wilfordii]
MLPPELINDIFCRLPVKALVRFKSIAKPIASLIEDPQFIAAHLKQSEETGNNHTLILIDRTHTTSSNDIIILQVKETTSIYSAFEKITCPLSGIVRVIGCLNGLLSLLNRENQIIVWNIATREHQVIPNQPPPLPLYLNEFRYSSAFTHEYYALNDDLFTHEFYALNNDDLFTHEFYALNNDDFQNGGLPDSFEEALLGDHFLYEDYKTYDSTVYGFGYNSIDDDYKLVKITKLVTGENLARHDTEIYSLKNGMWKMSTPLEGDGLSLISLKGTYFAGNLHWLGLGPLGSLPYKIVAFAVETEEFYVLPLPDELSVYNCAPKLVILGGSLFAVGYSRDLSSMNLWVLENYDMDKNSWTKLFSATVAEGFGHLSCPIFYSKGGDHQVLMKDTDGTVLWYDLEGKRVNEIHIPVHLQKGNGAEICVESLVRPKLHRPNIVHGSMLRLLGFGLGFSKNRPRDY